jgi:hypothetical protein
MKQIEEIYKKLNSEIIEPKTVPQPYQNITSPVRVNDIKQIKSPNRENKNNNKFITESRAEKLISSIFKKK